MTGRRRVLLVAHHFPPSGGSGANRALAMATFLREYGWEPTVLTVGTQWAIARDESLLAEVPADVRVVRTRSFEPRARGAVGAVGAVVARTGAFVGAVAARTTVGGGARQERPTAAARELAWAGLRRAGAEARRHVGHLKRFPDGHAGWIPSAVAAGLREPFDAIYTTSGPFSSHVIGMLLALSRGTPWVAELRDGWFEWNRAIFPDYPAWRAVLESRLESSAMHRADRVVLVTERMADAFRRQYPDVPTEHFAVVSNGFLPRDRAEASESAQPDVHASVTLLHVGALYYGRSVASLLHALRRALESRPDASVSIRLDLLGMLDAAADAEVRASGLTEHVRVLGQVDHATALAAMRQAHVLLLVANTTPGAEATVPGKLFEYLVSGRPILALTPEPSSTRDVLHMTGGAYLARPNDVEGIACSLRRAIDDVRAKRASPPKAEAVAQFDRRHLAAEMARILDAVVAEKTHARRV
ncbi:MAG: glycosyltransferase [Chloroflexota bacterium]